MPPRIPQSVLFGCSKLCLRPAAKAPSAALLPKIVVANASSKAERRRYRDPYALAQARQRKASNLKRQEELRKEREISMGDPVRGIETPFLKSFDTVTPLPSSFAKSSDIEPGTEKTVKTTPRTPLNHFLTAAELEKSFRHSYILTQPVVLTKRDLVDPAREAADIQQHAENHERATAAISRIISLANGNQKDRTRANIQRCIDTFGRHNTDTILRPRAPSNQPQGKDTPAPAQKTPRAGPDTGSSEVQVAILTAKIRVLADHLEKKGAQKDKINKRNMRVLVHKRQKLLTYLRRKERGSDRWENLTQTLGLTEGTWKGEISL